MIYLKDHLLKKNYEKKKNINQNKVFYQIVNLLLETTTTFFKKNQAILISTLIFLFNFLNQNTFKYNSISYINDPIFSKLTYLLNDSTQSIYIIYIIYVIIWEKKNKKFYTTIIFFYFFFQCSVHKYTNNFDFIFFSKQLNITLINGLLLIHPILLYASVTIFFIYRSIFENTKKKFFKKLNAKQFTHKISAHWYSFTALFLGCYWAQQETNWGGWWNWDPVEIIALLVWLNSLFYLHAKTSSYKIVYLNKNLLYSICILSYFLSRFDLLNSVHSFVAFSKNSKYLEIKFFFITFFFLQFCKLKTSYINIYIYSITAILIGILYHIYTNFLGTLSSDYNYKKEMILLIVMYYVAKQNITKFFFFNPIIYTNLNFSLYFLIIFLKKKLFQKNNYVHTILIVMFIFFIYESNTNIFIKSKKPDYFYQTYMNINNNWNISVNNYTSYLDFISKIETQICIQKPFDISKRFFFQNIITNIYYNINITNINSVLIFFQKNLFIITLITIVCILSLISNQKIHLKAV